jgi:hypothetical protein
MLKPFGIIGASALFLLVGSAVPVGAWQEKQEEKSEPARQEQEAKPEKRQQPAPEKQQQAKPPEQREQAKPAPQPRAKATKPEQQAKPEKQQQAKAPQEQKPKPQQAKPAKQEPRQATSQKQPQQKAASSKRPQRTQQAIAAQRAQPALRLSARGNSRIPEDRFKASFGAGHDFHMGNPVMVGGYSRFQYSGYWFGFVEPWPVGWYYTDAVYIDYVDGGYYMFDPYYPGARFAISVVL